MDGVITENWSVPDSMVGLSEFRIVLSLTFSSDLVFFLYLVIGRGGEQITSLQAETQCRVQLCQGESDANMSVSW